MKLQTNFDNNHKSTAPSDMDVYVADGDYDNDCILGKKEQNSRIGITAYVAPLKKWDNIIMEQTKTIEKKDKDVSTARKDY